MKRILISLLSLLLVCSTLFLCACGEDPDVDNPDEGNNGNDNDVIDVYDASNPMSDPSTGVLSALYNRSGLLAQPTEALFQGTCSESGKILTALADANAIIARGRPEIPLYGLYVFTHEYAGAQDDIVRVGFTNVRATRETAYDAEKDFSVPLFSDAEMMKFCENGIDIMYTVGEAATNGTTPSLSTFLPQKYGISYSVDSELYEDFDNYDIAKLLRRNIERALYILEKYGPRGSFFEQYPDVNYNPIRYIEVFNEPNFQYLLPVKKNPASVGGATDVDDAFAQEKYKLYAMIQVAVATAVRNIYGDEVKIVGLSVGGGAQDSGKFFAETVLSYTGDATLTKILNDAITPSALTPYTAYKDGVLVGEVKKNEDGTIVADDQCADFLKRKAEAQKVRDYLGLGDGDTIEIDMVGTMDVVSTHPYIDGMSPFAFDDKGANSQATATNTIRNAIIANALPGDEERAKNMPIWFTECGWQIKGREAYKNAYPEDYENGIYGGMAAEYSNVNTGTSQIIQAAMEVQDYLYGIRNGIDRITYMHLYDTDGCNYGLLNFGYAWGGTRTWRLVLHAFETMIDILPDPALVGVVAEKKIPGTDNYIYIYEIESAPGGEIVTTIFSPIAPQLGYQMEWDEDYAMVTDMFGKSQIVKAVNGKITVDAGPYMLYVRHVDRNTLAEYGLSTKIETTGIVAFFGNAWNTERDEDIL